MTKWLQEREPEWAGVPAWMEAGITGLYYMGNFEAAGFGEQEAGKLALQLCQLDTEQRTLYCRELKILLNPGNTKEKLDD